MSILDSEIMVELGKLSGVCLDDISKSEYDKIIKGLRGLNSAEFNQQIVQGVIGQVVKRFAKVIAALPTSTHSKGKINEVKRINSDAEFVRRIALSLQRKLRLPSNILIDDLIQEGMLALWLGKNRYNKESKAKFYSFIAPRVRGAMLDHLRSKASIIYTPRYYRGDKLKHVGTQNSGDGRKGYGYFGYNDVPRRQPGTTLRNETNNSMSLE